MIFLSYRKKFGCITRLLMGVGADCLRHYFLDIHPNWTNQPTDASALKKGALKLLNHEKQKFYLGNIDDLDVSLLIRVLRFSLVSSTQLKLHPDKDDALCKIKDIRNKIVGHAKNNKINEVDFKLYWKQLKVNLMIIGASENEIDLTLTSKYLITIIHACSHPSRGDFLFSFFVFISFFGIEYIRVVLV